MQNTWSIISILPFGQSHWMISFTNVVHIDHPTLCPIKSLEHPESININSFAKLLHRIKTDPETVLVNRSNFTMQKSKNICVIVEGFLLFALNDHVTSMFDIRIFLDSTQGSLSYPTLSTRSSSESRSAQCARESY